MAEEDDAVLGCGFVLAEEHVEDAVVPVRFWGEELELRGVRWVGGGGEGGWDEVCVGSKLGAGFQGVGCLGDGSWRVCRSGLLPWDVGGCGREDVGATRSAGVDGLIVALLLLRSWRSVLSALLALAFALPSVLLDQLHGGVILGSILELLDRLGPLLLMLLKSGGLALDSKVVIRSQDGASDVNALGNQLARLRVFVERMRGALTARDHRQSQSIHTGQSSYIPPQGRGRWRRRGMQRRGRVSRGLWRGGSWREASQGGIGSR